MKHHELSIAITLIIIALGALVTFVSVQVFHTDDAPLEQLAEEVVKDTTGISIDFTPES